MKTIWIIDHYSSEPKYGGISRQYDFAIELSKRGYKVIIISSGFSHYTHSYIGLSNNQNFFISQIDDNAFYVYLKTTKYKSNNGFGRMFNMFSFMFATLRYYNQFAKKLGRPDVVEGASVHPLSWIAAYSISKRYGVRFIAEVRDFWPEMWLLSNERKSYDPMVIFFSIVEKWAYRKADKIVYSLLYGDNYLHGKLKIPRDKILLIGQPLNCERFDEYAATKVNIVPEKVKQFMQNSFVCIFTGYYMEYEGVYVMLKAAVLLKERKIPVKMLFLGSGKEAAGMNEFVKDNSLNNVMIGERVNKEAIPSLLRHADICMAHAATKESKQTLIYGMSKNKINEYMYSGACIIFGREDENDPVARSGAGFVIKPYSAVEFANKIEIVYKMSEEDRKQFGENGKKYMRQYHNTCILTDKLISVLEP